MKIKQRYTALYERHSHDDELQGESNSISNQKQLWMEYAVSHQIPEPRHFSDDGISGTRFDRPAFLEMIKEVEEGKIGIVLVKDMKTTRKRLFESRSYSRNAQTKECQIDSGK